MSDAMELENQIALEDYALGKGVMQLGPPSVYTCPECHGVMIQIQEGSIVRFRCHTGHAYSLQNLLSEVNEAIDNNLWSTIRAVEERILLLYQMEQLARVQQDEAAAAQCAQQAHQAEERVQQLRQLVLASDELGLDSMVGEPQGLRTYTSGGRSGNGGKPTSIGVPL
jgi:two-component system, chemotaxis family, protein-glutamate methylesterase/glutaminase